MVRVNPSANAWKGSIPASPNFYTCQQLTRGDSTPLGSTTALTNGCYRLSFIAQPDGGVVNTPFSIQPAVAVQGMNGSIQNNFTGPVTLSIKNGTGTTGAFLTGATTVNAVQGVAIFSGLAISTAGSGYVLTASSSGSLGAESSPFAIAPASRLYAASMTGGNVLTIDTFTNTLVGSPATINGGPFGLAVNPAGTRLYVSDVALASAVHVLDITSSTPLLVGTVPISDGT
jgi:DNA-binding beta-propeller fold protein YncE